MLVYILATAITVALCAWLCPWAERAKAGTIPGSALADQKVYKTRKVFSCGICMLPLLLVMSCRWGLGVDLWHTYAPGYLVIKSESVSLTNEEEEILLKSCQLNAWWNGWGGKSVEEAQTIPLEQAYALYRQDYPHTGIGFQLMERLLAVLRADVQWFIFATSLLVIGFVFASIWVQSTRPMWAALFFVITANFFVALNVVAQYIAVAICLFACTFAEKRKPIWFFLLTAIAISFHYSAIVFLPVYFLPGLKVRPLWCVVGLALALVFSRFAYPVISQLVKWMAPNYINYISGEAGGVEFEWIFLGINIAVFLLSTWYYPKGKDLPYYRLWYNLNVLAMIAMAFSGVVPWMKRVNYYYAASHFLLIPLALSLEEKPFRRIMFHAVTVLLFCTEIYVAIWMKNKHGTLPYMAFFQGNRVEMLRDMFKWIR